jgi:hypothetical protein
VDVLINGMRTHTGDPTDELMRPTTALQPQELQAAMEGWRPAALRPAVTTVLPVTIGQLTPIP